MAEQTTFSDFTVPAADTRRYRVRHRGSKFYDRIVRLLIRPRVTGGPRNCMAECVDNGEWFVCPFRGLRRVKC